MTKTQKINQIMDDFETAIFNLAKTKKYAKSALTYLICRDRLIDALHNPLKDD